MIWLNFDRPHSTPTQRAAYVGQLKQLLSPDFRVSCMCYGSRRTAEQHIAEQQREPLNAALVPRLLLHLAKFLGISDWPEEVSTDR